ncbi:MAG TPA: hypothetical protein VN706_15275 [Gemmatimonadaceae bacterium]|nr:hypothetical protein [Gemmatimonadaceae bacterium]
MKRLLAVSAILLLGVTAAVRDRTTVRAPYVPVAVLCANESNTLCSIVPAYIGTDSSLKRALDYGGIFGKAPTSSATDVETPFDNMAWQMFVALNWAANATTQPPAKGLTAAGPRVWENFKRISALFGNSPKIANCANPSNLTVFSIGSNGKGKPAPNNEEFFQASTDLPLIDVNGNWTVYERRVNDIEANYLQAPDGKRSQTLTTIAGQDTFVKYNPAGAQFTASATTPTGANGSIEVKTSWRIMNANAGDDTTRYFTERAILAVAGDLVVTNQPICATVTLGLVGMHIIQRNPPNAVNANLKPQWIWATFEHVDNAPLAKSPCSVVSACSPRANWMNQPSCGAAAPSTSTRYSYFNKSANVAGTNIIPVSNKADKRFVWSAAQPYANGATTPASALPQVSRCWAPYPLTAQINRQWQKALASVQTPFRNYALIGTQWGAAVTRQTTNPVPTDAVPGMLSNVTLETYIQNFTLSDTGHRGPGSCISCHNFATLAVGGRDKATADFSFLPGLAQPSTARAAIKSIR